MKTPNTEMIRSVRHIRTLYSTQLVVVVELRKYNILLKICDLYFRENQKEHIHCGRSSPHCLQSALLWWRYQRPARTPGRPPPRVGESWDCGAPTLLFSPWSGASKLWNIFLGMLGRVCQSDSLYLSVFGPWTQTARTVTGFRSELPWILRVP